MSVAVNGWSTVAGWLAYSAWGRWRAVIGGSEHSGRIVCPPGAAVDSRKKSRRCEVSDSQRDLNCREQQLPSAHLSVAQNQGLFKPSVGRADGFVCWGRNGDESICFGTWGGWRPKRD